MSDWHHGYAAGDILRAVALAYEEAADNWFNLPDLPEFAMGAEFLRATSTLIEYRAKDLAPTAYDLIAEMCSGLLHSGRALIGTPIGSNRLDYLLCAIANQRPDWIEPLKRRKSWLGPRDPARRLKVVADDLSACPKCDGTGRIEPDESGYDGCDLCNYGDGPTGFVRDADMTSDHRS